MAAAPPPRAAASPSQSAFPLLTQRRRPASGSAGRQTTMAMSGKERSEPPTASQQQAWTATERHQDRRPRIARPHRLAQSIAPRAYRGGREPQRQERAHKSSPACSPARARGIAAYQASWRHDRTATAKGPVDDVRCPSHTPGTARSKYVGPDVTAAAGAHPSRDEPGPGDTAPT